MFSLRPVPCTHVRSFGFVRGLSLTAGCTFRYLSRIEEAVIDVITYAVTWSESESTPHYLVIENPKIASS